MTETPNKSGEKVTFASDVKPQQGVVEPILKKMQPTKKKIASKTALLALGIVLAGVASGYGLNIVSGGSLGIKSSTEVSETGVKEGDVIGSEDEKTFKDKAIGVMEKGGIDGEGSHHLLRSGGPDQTAYLTSSIVDLDLFVGHQVEIWGETFAAQKAGWLLDVGRVRVLKLDAPKPFEDAQ